MFSNKTAEDVSLIRRAIKDLYDKLLDKADKSVSFYMHSDSGKQSAYVSMTIGDAIYNIIRRLEAIEDKLSKK
jgi:hypothetical protein